jgi:peptidoglycan-associated lipoprotein
MRQRPQKHTVVGISTTALAMVLCGLCACAPLSSNLRDLNREGQHHEVVQTGNEWLREHALDPEAAAEGKKVRVQVAVARMRLVETVDTVEAWVRYIQEFSRFEETAHLIEVARQGEASAWYRTRTLKAETTADHVLFRNRYPKSDLLPDSKTREAEIALDAAKNDRSVEAFRIFRRKYGDWEEAGTALGTARQLELEAAMAVADGLGTAGAWRDVRKNYAKWAEAHEAMPGIRTKELDLAYSEAISANMPHVWRTFRGEYASWPEAQEKVKAAYEAEATRALEIILAEGDLDALSGYRRDYPEDRWQEAAHRAEVEIGFQTIASALDSDGMPYTADVESFLDRHEGSEYLDAVADGREPVLWGLATDNEEVAYLRMYRTLYPGTDRARSAWKRETELAWQGALAADEPEAWARFLRLYATTSRAAEAERRFYLSQRLRDASTRWPRAEISRIRKVGKSTFDIYLNVRDCFGERVAGLTRGVFEVFADGEPVVVDRFWGLEEDRPIDLVFAIDISGSMSTEIEAVQAAVLDFVETFRFRGRDVRLGLVTFSDSVAKVHQPTASTRHFKRWISGIERSTGGGGSGEDGVHALLTAGSMHFGANSERAVIMMSDEHLQINRGGRAALGVKGDAQCRRLMKVARCIQRCKKAVCLGKCWGMISADHRRWLNKCQRRYGMKRCLYAMNWDNLIPALEQCSAPVGEYSKEMGALAERLNRRKVRPFFLVPEQLSGFDRVAELTDGQTMAVPQDGTDPEPYIDALYAIADQLSKEYILRVRVPAKLKDPRLIVAVRNMHHWNPSGNAPRDQIIAMIGTPPDDTDIIPASCSVIHALTPSKLWRSEDCGEQWDEVELVGEPSKIVGYAHDQSLLLVQTDAGVISVSLEYDEMEVLDLGHHRIESIALTVDGAVWATAHREGAWDILRREPDRSEFTAVRSFDNEMSIGGPLLLTSPDAPDVCTILPSSKRLCTLDGGETWIESRATGLPPSAFAGAVEVTRVPSRRGVFVAALSDGSVVRSIDYGARWNKTLGAVPARTQLASIMGERPAVCASRPEGLLCSEDAGRSWYPVLRPGGGQPGGTITVAGRDLFLAQDGVVYRLDRVLNREIPSSAVYFATGKSKPLAAMHPFLELLAAVLKRNPELYLNVEGHADKRGSVEYNEALSRDRARNVRSYLVDAGADSERVQVAHYGERRPIRPGSTSSDLSRNRRVELILMRRVPVAGWGSSNCDE